MVEMFGVGSVVHVLEIHVAETIDQLHTSFALHYTKACKYDNLPSMHRRNYTDHHRLLSRNLQYDIGSLGSCCCRRKSENEDDGELCLKFYKLGYVEVLN